MYKRQHFCISFFRYWQSFSCYQCNIISFHLSLIHIYMAQAIKNHPQRLKAFASINPMFGKEAISEIERCVSLGFCGIGELGPGANGFDFQSPQFLDVLECAVHYHLPVCIHCGEPIGHTYPCLLYTSLDNHTQIVPFFSVFVLCFLNSFVMIQPLVLYFT